MKNCWKFFLFLLLCLAFNRNSFSADVLVTQLQKTYQSIVDWQADFTQATFVDLLGRNVEKKGIIQIRKPGKLRIEYKDDDAKTYVSNGKKLWVYSPVDLQVEIYSKISNLMDKQVLSFLEGLGNINEQFSVLPQAEGSMSDSQLQLLSLKPKTMDSTIDHLILGINSQTGLVQEMILFNVSGNTTHYVFSSIQLNPGLKDELFNFNVPDGVREVKGYE